MPCVVNGQLWSLHGSVGNKKVSNNTNAVWLVTDGNVLSHWCHLKMQPAGDKTRTAGQLYAIWPIFSICLARSAAIFCRILCHQFRTKYALCSLAESEITISVTWKSIIFTWHWLWVNCVRHKCRLCKNVQLPFAGLSHLPLWIYFQSQCHCFFRFIILVNCHHP